MGFKMILCLGQDQKAIIDLDYLYFTAIIDLDYLHLHPIIGLDFINIIKQCI